MQILTGYSVDLFLLSVSLATIGVCIFCAVTSVAVLFYLQKKFLGETFMKKKILSILVAILTFIMCTFSLLACSVSNSKENGNADTQNPDDSNGSNQNNKYANYSQILQNVLTGVYYYQQIGNAESSNNVYEYTSSHNNYEPIPYAFMEEQGYDVSKYKDNKLNCFANIFSINNDLFVELHAEIEYSTNYYANYVLKYNLTDQELKELYCLHAPLFSNDGKTTYFQAPFFVQELSYLREPEILSISYATSACNNSANEYFDKKKFLSTYHISSYIKSEPVENSQTCYHYYLIRPRITSSRGNSKVAVVKMHTTGHYSFCDGDRYVFNTTNLLTTGGITKENRIKFEESIQSIVTYNSASHHFKDLTTWDNWENWEEDFNSNN